MTADHIDRIIAESSLLKQIAAAREIERRARRKLTSEEIAILQRQGNSCGDWGSIQVSRGFDPRWIVGNAFAGACVLGAFSGKELPVETGLRLPTGIYRSTLSDAVLDDDCLVYECPLIVNYIIGCGAVMSHARAVAGQAPRFGNGQSITVGPETGGREITGFAELDLTLAAAIATRRSDHALLAACEEKTRAYCDLAACGRGVALPGAIVRNGSAIRDACIGAGAIIDSGALVENATVVGGEDEPTLVAEGALVRDSAVQWGSVVRSGAIVEQSALLEHAHAERHGKVRASVLGPNSGVAEGEVTSSLVGPFVGFHHQALLIAAIWPEGKGNVGYGANVGSNHTGKAPDQEIRCGEGLFFGLGVNVKFPADFSEAPYTIIATGVDLAPQKLAMPFSLINKPVRADAALPPSLNELFPGWMLADNIYAIRRNEAKYRSRNRARRTPFDSTVFRPEIIDQMARARDSLAGVTEKKSWYTERDIAGVGKNFVSDRARRVGVQAYGLFLEYYALEGVYRRALGLSRAGQRLDQERIYSVRGGDAVWVDQHQTLRREGCIERPLIENIRRYAEIVSQIAAKVESAKARDEGRGAQIIADYREVHPPAIADSFIEETRRWAREIEHEAHRLIASAPG